MPIRSVDQRVREQFPRIGRLRKGAPKRKKRDANGDEYETWGEDLHWFRFVTDNPAVLAALAKHYGAEPDSMEIMLPHSTVEANFDYMREYYRAGGLDFYCDEKFAYLWRDDDGYMRTDPKPCPYCSGAKLRTSKDPGCRPAGYLTVILPKLVEEGFAGHILVETHSWNDIYSILGSLKYAASLRQRNVLGLRGIVWRLYRVPNKVSTPFSKDERRKRARREKWLVKLEPTAQWVQAQIEAEKAAALLPDPRMALLQAANAEVDAACVLGPNGRVNLALVGRTPEEVRQEWAEVGQRLMAEMFPGVAAKRAAIEAAQAAKAATPAPEPVNGDYRVEEPETPQQAPAPAEPEPGWKQAQDDPVRESLRPRNGPQKRADRAKPSPQAEPEPEPKPEGETQVVPTPSEPVAPAWDKATGRQFDARARHLFELRRVKYSENDVQKALGCLPKECTIPYSQAIERLTNYLDTVAKPQKTQAREQARQEAML